MTVGASDRPFIKALPEASAINERNPIPGVGREFRFARDSPLEQTGFELQVPPRTTDRWLAPARHPTGCTEASPLPWRGCGFIDHSAG